MSNANPIIPPGSPLQRQSPASNSKLMVSVFIILAVHACILSGLLIQGCKRQDVGRLEDLSTNAEPAFARMPTSQVPPDNAVKPIIEPPPQTNAPVLPPPSASPQPAVSEFVATPPPMPNSKVVV